MHEGPEVGIAVGFARFLQIAAVRCWIGPHKSTPKSLTKLSVFGVLVALAGAVQQANASMLLDLKDPAGQSSTAISRSFIAASAITELDIAGFKFQHLKSWNRSI